jgi:hypothetical protein
VREATRNRRGSTFPIGTSATLEQLDRGPHPLATVEAERPAVPGGPVFRKPPELNVVWD